jgi:hypothetical protein
MSNKSAILLWAVGLPVVCIIAGAFAKMAGDDYGDTIGAISLVAGIFALLKFYAAPAFSYWKCPDCRQKFNFDFHN